MPAGLLRRLRAAPARARLAGQPRERAASVQLRCGGSTQGQPRAAAAKWAPGRRSCVDSC
eukprot:1722505-Prymnesium_polylepis.1